MLNSAPKHERGSKRRRKPIELSDDDSDHCDQIEQLSDSTDSYEPCSSRAEHASQLSNSSHGEQLSPFPTVSFENKPVSKTWTELFDDPSVRSGLLISTRKANEIRAWLNNAFKFMGPRFLILGGPPGCGKSSALRAICSEMDCDLLTWQAPACIKGSISAALLDDLESFVVGTRYPGFRVYDADLTTSTSEVEPSLRLHRRVLMIDDLPISAIDLQGNREATCTMMRKVAQFAPHPTVLVLSDSAKGIARTARLVLGFDFITSSDVASINIPPVTGNVMRKRLREVGGRMQVKILQQAIDDVIIASSGDFRAALNCLQFSSNLATSEWANGQNRQNISRTVHKRQRRKCVYPAIARVVDVGADGTLGTYHAVAKILINKRDEHGRSENVAEDILHEARVETSNFLEFLYHNYPDFFGNSDDIVSALSCLSDADTFLPWIQDDDSRTMLSDCAASLATRGFLLFNTLPIQSGWRPIKGPESYEIRCDGQEFALLARDRLAPITSLQVYSSTDVLETLPYVEAIQKQRLKPWGMSVKHYVKRNNVVDGADVAMVDAEMSSHQRTDHRQSAQTLLRPEALHLPHSNQTLVEDIEEWDD